MVQRTPCGLRTCRLHLVLAWPHSPTCVWYKGRTAAHQPVAPSVHATPVYMPHLRAPPSQGPSPDAPAPLATLAADNKQSLSVEWTHLTTCEPLLGVWLCDAPRPLIEAFNAAAFDVACELYPEYRSMYDTVYCRWSGLTMEDSLRDLRWGARGGCWRWGRSLLCCYVVKLAVAASGSMVSGQHVGVQVCRRRHMGPAQPSSQAQALCRSYTGHACPPAPTRHPAPDAQCHYLIVRYS